MNVQDDLGKEQEGEIFTAKQNSKKAFLLATIVRIPGRLCTYLSKFQIGLENVIKTNGLVIKSTTHML